MLKGVAAKDFSAIHAPVKCIFGLTKKAGIWSRLLRKYKSATYGPMLIVRSLILFSSLFSLTTFESSALPMM